jgi:hypothetical protein
LTSAIVLYPCVSSPPAVLRGAVDFLAAATHPRFRITVEISEQLIVETEGAVNVTALLVAAGYSISGSTVEGDGEWVKVAEQAGPPGPPP